jgi:hypothetical protein
LLLIFHRFVKPPFRLNIGITKTNHLKEDSWSINDCEVGQWSIYNSVLQQLQFLNIENSCNELHWCEISFKSSTLTFSLTEQVSSCDFVVWYDIVEGFRF